MSISFCGRNADDGYDSQGINLLYVGLEEMLVDGLLIAGMTRASPVGK